MEQGVCRCELTEANGRMSKTDGSQYFSVNQIIAKICWNNKPAGLVYYKRISKRDTCISMELESVLPVRSRMWNMWQNYRNIQLPMMVLGTSRILHDA